MLNHQITEKITCKCGKDFITPVLQQTKTCANCNLEKLKHLTGEARRTR